MIESVRAVPRWRHATSFTEIRRYSHIAVFDDERAGKAYTLYRTDGRRFSPITTLPIEPRGKLEKALELWASDRPLLDLRDDRTSPLPGAVEPPALLNAGVPGRIKP